MSGVTPVAVQCDEDGAGERLLVPLDELDACVVGRLELLGVLDGFGGPTVCVGLGDVVGDPLVDWDPVVVVDRDGVGVVGPVVVGFVVEDEVEVRDDPPDGWIRTVLGVRRIADDGEIVARALGTPGSGGAVIPGVTVIPGTVVLLPVVGLARGAPGAGV